MEKLLKNLRVMDLQIKHAIAQDKTGTGLVVYALHDAEQLMRALVARNAYSEVDMSVAWEPDMGYAFKVYVWWD